MNHRLHEYESQQFLNPDPDALVLIEKTETHGDPYDTVLYGDQAINYLRPFVFTLATTNTRRLRRRRELSERFACTTTPVRAFDRGKPATSPVTRHLALSQTLLFLFDPTQDPRFAKPAAGSTAMHGWRMKVPRNIWERQEDQSPRGGRPRATRACRKTLATAGRWWWWSPSMIAGPGYCRAASSSRPGCLWAPATPGSV